MGCILYEFVFQPVLLFFGVLQTTVDFDDTLGYLTQFVAGKLCQVLYVKTLIGGCVYMPQMIIDTLQLPRLVMPVATITLGWPDEQPPLTDRLPLDAIMHSETYTDYTTKSIDQFYAEKEALEENREFCRINNKQTLAQVYTDCRYTKKDNETMSEGMLEALRKQGFLE